MTETAEHPSVLIADDQADVLEALRLARLDEHQRRERMLRRIRARHPVQPDRDTDRQQTEQE